MLANVTRLVFNPRKVSVDLVRTAEVLKREAVSTAVITSWASSLPCPCPRSSGGYKSATNALGSNLTAHAHTAIAGSPNCLHLVLFDFYFHFYFFFLSLSTRLPGGLGLHRLFASSDISQLPSFLK